MEVLKVSLSREDMARITSAVGALAFLMEMNGDNKEDFKEAARLHILQGRLIKAMSEADND